MKRQISETDKQRVIAMQRESDGSLQCFISGEVINLQSDDHEFDHIQPHSKDGNTDVVNIRVVLKKYNRRKSDQSLYQVRDNLNLEKLFVEKKNSIKLQDILTLKQVERRPIHVSVHDSQIEMSDGTDSRAFTVFSDPILGIPYFYGRVPLKWVQNDDQEGLQPRVIDYKRLITLREHLKDHPQMAPAVARLLDGSIRLFDGQHKVAAQILNEAQDIDIKVYVSPSDETASKKLFDAQENALGESALQRYIAEASKDSSFPLTQDLMNKAVFPVCLYLQPSLALFDSAADYRNHELANFRMLADLLVEETFLKDWVQRQANTTLTNPQLKARRIWHKGSVLTWSPYLKDIIINTFNMRTEDERSRLLYKPEMTQDERERIRTCLSRLFNHPIWDTPEGEIDNLLVSAQKQDALFVRNGLTPMHVLTGSA